MQCLRLGGTNFGILRLAHGLFRKFRLPFGSTRLSHLIPVFFSDLQGFEIRRHYEIHLV